MLLSFKDFTPDQFYFLTIQTLIPRPIAWVLSDNGNDSYNLAPFSFFNAVCSNPPILMISVGWKDDTNRKDTWINIEQRNDFVIHIPTESDAQQVVASSASFSHGVSEVSQLGLSLEEVKGQRLPRIIGPKVAFFCRKYSIQEIGLDRQAIILGEVKDLWVDDEAIHSEKDRLIVDPVKINPVARLGGHGYSLLAKPFYLKRSQ